MPLRAKVEHCCSGLSIDILARLGQVLNFNYTIYEMESGGYGSDLDVCIPDFNCVSKQINYKNYTILCIAENRLTI